MQITRLIPASQINPPDVPIRTTMDEEKLEDLARSIGVEGLINALTVEPVDSDLFSATEDGWAFVVAAYIEQGGKFEVIAGHRRYLACLHINIKEIRCEVFPKGSTNKTSRKFHENAYREDMTPAEEGWAYLELAEKENLNLEQICNLTRQTPGYVNTRVDLVRGDSEVALAVHARTINMSVARELNKCTAEPYRRYLLGRAIAEGSSALQAKTWVLNWKVQEGILAVPPMQPPTLTPDAPLQPFKPACFLCGGDEDPYNLDNVYVHRHERAQIEQLRQNLVPENPPEIEPEGTSA